MAQSCIGRDGKDRYEHERVGSYGGYGLLPAISGFVTTLRFKIVVCMKCGLMQYYADEKARGRISISKKWRKS